MEQKNDGDKVDEIMLPGFRFHPTDEELVAFYLKRKVQQRPLSIELIKQLDIYKYDPWDLPKFAATGEKEWYFYCPRDRKYRNSARPNRVTGAGFWKATGTDRPIYSSEGSKCIGLKKSLVFYKGRAAKGMKTDWMMHEFRLPSLADSTPPKRFMDKTIPANDAWAICRIFKKTNSTAQRALSQSWVSPVTPETIISPDHHGLISCRQSNNANHQFTSSENISSLTTTHASSNIIFPNAYNTSFQQSPNNYYSPLDVPSYKSVYPTILQKLPQDHQQQLSISNHRILDLPLTTSFMFSPLEMFGGHQAVKTSAAAHHDDFVKASEDRSIEFSGSQGLQCNSNLSEALLPPHQEMTIPGVISSEEDQIHDFVKNSHSQYGDFLDDQWTPPASVRANNVNGFLPFNLPLNLVWDSSPCPTEMSTTCSTTSTKCYT